MKKLNEIISCSSDILIKNIKTDSREVEKGDLFIAINGYNVKHSEFIDDAIKNGASAVISDIFYDADIPIIKVDDVDSALEEVCKKFYNYKDSLNLIGVTGTDGKTSTATIISELLNGFLKTSYMGTNGIKVENKYIRTNNTTPAKEKLYEYFSYLDKSKCKNVSMEVSSEALFHKRVNSFKFKYIIYTNITEDHLNIHKNVENYINTKLGFVNLIDENGTIIINSDDENCKKLLGKNKLNIYSYGKSENSDFKIENISYTSSKTEFDIKHENKIYHVISPYAFEYNIYNLVAAFIVCYLEGMDINTLLSRIEKLQPIPGRGEFLHFGQDYEIFLDYAHTENSIKTVIDSVKNKFKRLILVTGAAGGREKEKRPRIGKYILNTCDFVVFTMDDPRYENVLEIINQMIGNINKDNYIKIVDRKKAIEYALNMAQTGDIVLILGKGRDDYMAIGDKKIPYSDYSVIKNYFDK